MSTSRAPDQALASLSPAYSPSSPAYNYSPDPDTDLRRCIAETDAKRKKLQPVEKILRSVASIGKKMGVGRKHAAKCLVHIAQNQIPVLQGLETVRGHTFREIDYILCKATNSRVPMEFYMSDDSVPRKDIEKCRHLLETEYGLTYKDYTH